MIYGMANKYGRQDTPVSYKEYVESEQSLLEQIRVKEEGVERKNFCNWAGIFWYY